ncbi:mechanosensitive ion channel family protein [Actinoallomurus rhizosphaericola]|uniref:mechanosensitive ion channel family protein n=1 Tax=Actinoallomurus rhizosphaericola TaxID=2952536 RepID=UPI0020933D8F|nr:mechanosensitive ion channel domain-containing protein [Actinoallomurus rhizosphaericola]MCO5999878.1 mechanosensitive ion channel family protein [Actinoallomurus rhizosphaericola]
MFARLAMSVLPSVSGKTSLKDACKTDPNSISEHITKGCQLTWNLTHNGDLTYWYHVWLDGSSPITWTVKLILTIVIAYVLRRLTHKLITKITVRMAEGTMPERLREKTRTIFDGSPVLVSERRRQRAETMGSVLRSIASVIILGAATLTVLGYLGLNLTPFLASASIIGVAVAFGAQNLVKDFLTGMFMLLEDQYGVGDVIDVGTAKGTVEAVTLRTTRLRDVNGVVWYVPNGEIKRVGNESQNWSRVVLDIPVEYDADLDKVRTLLSETASALAAEPPWDEIILEDPTVWGVQALSGEAVVVRVVCKTAPGQQGDTARELRERVKKAFDSAGVPIAPFKEDSPAA